MNPSRYPLLNIGGNTVSEIWFNVAEAASYLRTTPGSVRNLVYRRQITSYKPFGKLLFKKDDLDRAIRTSKRGGHDGN